MLPEPSVGDPWWAAMVAVIYFGSVIAFGAAARFISARLMSRHGVEIGDVQEQAGGAPSQRDAFLLGISRKDR